jgi:hypothetical protein
MSRKLLLSCASSQADRPQSYAAACGAPCTVLGVMATRQNQTSSRRAARRVTAVDAKAKNYWSEYFGAYGAQWVRDVPLKITAALGERLFAKKAARPDLALTDVQIGPLGHAIVKNAANEVAERSPKAPIEVSFSGSSPPSSTRPAR